MVWLMPAKWLGTTLIILATLCRVTDHHVADLLFGIAGTSAWTAVAVSERDIPLGIVNVVMLFVMLFGVIR